MDAVCEDAETAPLPERDKALFRYLSKVNDTPALVTKADAEAARTAGWSDAALYDAVTVCAIFNFFNRWIDGMGVPDVPREVYEARVAAGGGMAYTM